MSSQMPGKAVVAQAKTADDASSAALAAAPSHENSNSKSLGSHGSAFSRRRVLVCLNTNRTTSGPPQEKFLDEDGIMRRRCDSKESLRKTVETRRDPNSKWQKSLAPGGSKWLVHKMPLIRRFGLEHLIGDGDALRAALAKAVEAEKARLRAEAAAAKAVRGADPAVVAKRKAQRASKEATAKRRKLEDALAEAASDSDFAHVLDLCKGQLTKTKRQIVDSLVRRDFAVPAGRAHEIVAALEPFWVGKHQFD